MKHALIVCLSLLAFGTASAQKALLKEVGSAMAKDATTYPNNIQRLTPAFTNPETAEFVDTWYTAGKGAFDFYDKQQVMLQMKQDVDKKTLGHALLDGYGYFLKALPLDSIPDAKGKIKPKRSKDILKLIKGHHNDFFNAALYMWDVQDYKGAVDAWDLYLTLPDNALYALTAIPDSTKAEITFNKGIGYSLLKDDQAALNAFKDAIAQGYTQKNAFDYAIAAASSLQQPSEMAAIAKQAYPLYGKEDSHYIGYIVNELIQSKKFAEADDMLNKYIQAEPNNAQLYFVKGILLESEEKPDQALQAYKKSLALNPNDAQAQFRVGYILYQDALKLDQDVPADMKQADYKVYRADKVDPVLKEAASYLEKSLLNDDTVTDSRTVLRSIYYNLNDDENYKRVSEM